MAQARARVVQIALDRRAHTRVAAPAARTRARVATALGVLVLLAAASLTPPVQALAEHLGELVGIGDEPTRNTRGLIDEPAVVIGAGESPNGTAYEVVASADTNIYHDDQPRTCIGLDLPQLEGPTNAGCLTPGLEASLDPNVVAPIAFLGPPQLGADRLIIDGLASPRVVTAEIERVTDDGSIDRYPVQVSHLDGDLASEIGSSGEAAFLLAFLPEDLVPPPPPPGPPGANTPAIPVPAPGSTFEGGPPVIGRAPLSVTPESEEASPAKQALARLSLVAYDDERREIAREPLDRQPFSNISLYAALSFPRDEGAARLLEDCFREVLPQYGTPGEIPPQLPKSFGDDLNDCAAERRQRRVP